MLQLGDLVLGARGSNLDPHERRERHDQDREQHLGGLAQLPGLPRDFLGDPHGGAGATRRRRSGAGLDLPPRLRPPSGGQLGGGGGERFARGVEQVKLDGRPLGAEPDHVAVLEERVARDPGAVDIGAVAAAEVLEEVALGLANQGRVAGGDVEVALGVEAHVGERMAAETDVRLREDFDLADAGAREEPELRLHWLRAAK